MCQSCIDIDKQVEHFRELLRSLTDLAEIERITQLIAKLYADRVRLHQNPE
jgi:vacuolar-type H+-ATPase subunit D/Vma8